MRRVAWVGMLLAGVVACGVPKDQYLKEVGRAQSLEARLAEREARLTQVEKELAGLRKRCEETAAHLERARELVALKEAEAERAREESERCRRELADVSTALDVCTKGKRSLEEDCRSQVEGLERELEGERLARGKERVGWQARLEACRSEVADLTARLEVLQEEKRRLEQEKRERLDELARTYEGLLESLQQQVEEGRVTIQRLKGKLSVRMLDEILFDSGSAEIKPEGREVLRQVGEVLKQQADKAIVIEGHTDNVPISGALAERFPTNWELSTARATSVVRFLQDVVGIAPERLSAVGYGPYRPVAPNDTPEGRARNRRIEIKLVPLEAPLFGTGGVETQ